MASVVAAAKLRRSASASARTSSSSRSDAGSARCRSSARLAWRAAVSSRPVRSAAVAASSSAATAWAPMLGLTPSTLPSSASSSAAVAAWWATSSIGDPRSAITAATPACRCAAHSLGQRLIGDFAHDGAAEAPPVAVDVEQPVGGQLVEVAAAELLAELLAEPLERGDGVAGAQHGGVVDDRPLRRRQLVEAGGDEGAQRPGELGVLGAGGGQSGQLDEEQRVAAATGDELGHRPVAVVGRAALEEAADQGRRLLDAERAERHLQHDRALDCRWPVDIGVRSLARDHQERQLGQRAHDDAELVAQARLGPLQVVDPQHGHPRLGVAPQHVGERGGDGVACAGRVEAVERRAVAEQEGDRVQVAAHDVVVGVDAPQLDRPRPDGGLDVRRRRVGIEAEQRRQPVDHGGQRVRLAVRGARRADDDRLVLERLDDLVGQAGLAGARLTDDRDDATTAVADELYGGLEEGPLVHTADERDVAPDRAAAGGRRARHEPRLLGLLTATDVGVGERLAADRRRAQRRRRRTDEHAAGRSQRLQAGSSVDDVAHRRVVRTGQRADEHLAGVDADAHLDRRVGADVVDEAGQRRLHAQRRPHGPFGIVLVGDGRTEQGDDGVAEQLVDAPAELLDVGDEALETGLDEPLHTLRIEVLGE